MCLACAGDEVPDIGILYCGVDALPERRTIPNRLSEFQRLVGGWIELFGLRDGVYIVCNEEGRKEALRPNRVIPGGDIMMGNFFVTAVANSFHRSLTEEEITEVLALLDGTGVFHGV